jgi:hypothetical protein
LQVQDRIVIERDASIRKIGPRSLPGDRADFSSIF